MSGLLGMIRNKYSALQVIQGSLSHFASGGGVNSGELISLAIGATSARKKPPNRTCAKRKANFDIYHRVAWTGLFDFDLFWDEASFVQSA